MKDMVKEVLSELSEKQIKRIKNTSKEYIYFHVSVFNAGCVVRVKCSNLYKDINSNTWNGCDFMLESWDAVECLNKLNK
jgi:hypothetical protein|nr:MAG TPA: hypothetical protein [Caudoviricetes sp.]